VLKGDHNSEQALNGIHRLRRVSGGNRGHIRSRDSSIRSQSFNSAPDFQKIFLSRFESTSHSLLTVIFFELGSRYSDYSRAWTTGVRFPVRDGNFPLVTASRPALVPSQSPIQLVIWISHRGLKLPGCSAYQLANI
jgi:hypothetical protein